MNEHHNQDMENIQSSKQEVSLSSEQGMENHENSEINEKDIKGQDGTYEKKPIKNILFVDDEESVRKIFKEALEKFGYKVTVAPNGNEGIKLFRENPVELIITDIFMPEKDGHAFILEIMQEFPDTRVFAITGKQSYDLEMELNIAQTLGAVKVFTKPCKLSELIEAIKEFSPQLSPENV
jgi:CheY-like chemotaxis protein